MKKSNENIVEDCFYKHNIPMYYYRDNFGVEIDFVSKMNNKICLIEVKSKSGRTKSSDKIMESNKDTIDSIIKLSSQNIGCVGNKRTYPYYLVSFLFK